MDKDIQAAAHLPDNGVKLVRLTQPAAPVDLAPFRTRLAADL
jgi:hypothetical protein